MRRSVLCLILMLIMPGLCQGEGPILQHTLDPMALPSVLIQTMNLWIEAAEPWKFWAECPEGLSFLDQDSRLVQRGVIASGSGPHSSSYEVEVHFDPTVLSAGRHSLPMQVCLEGAQGILGLPVFDQIWILPLNSGKVQVRREGGRVVPVPSGQWFLAEPSDGILYDQNEVFLFGSVPAVKTSHVRTNYTDLWWPADSLRLATGDWGDVRLFIQGPSPGGELILRASPFLLLGQVWTLGGSLAEQARSTDGDLRIFLPSLPQGVHELRGTVQALLPDSGGVGQIWALWQGKKAVCSIEIDRSWFEQGRGESLQVDTTSTLLFPNGRLRHMGGRGTVSVESGTLDVIIPLADPSRPIWTGLPLGGIALHERRGQDQSGAEDFVLPVFLWDQGFSWRLVTRTGPWLLHALPERQSVTIQGKSGATSVEVFPSEHRATFSYSTHRSYSEGGWSWWDTPDWRKGMYSQGQWLYTLDIPKQSGHLPAWGVHYRGNQLGFRLSQEEASVEVLLDSWGLGASLNRRFWLENTNVPLRLEITSQGVRLTHQDSSGRDWQVKTQKGSIQVNLKDLPWEGYLKAGSQTSWEGGLRYRKSWTQGPFLSQVFSALQIKNKTTFWETKGQLGYALAPWCTLYAEGHLRSSVTWEGNLLQRDLSYGGGVILRPLPQMVAQVGWSTSQGWLAKAGLVIPFVGRKTQANSE